MLKQYIDVHWSNESEKFRPPETSAVAKQSIRNMLPLGLKESISKVRNTVAFSLAGKESRDRDTYIDWVSMQLSPLHCQSI